MHQPHGHRLVLVEALLPERGEAQRSPDDDRE
jgi:hypothetical protein